MGNLALKRLPLEKDTWENASAATDGKKTGYTGTSGFAYADWPCEYTIDLEKEYKLEVIRFLLWDNLGLPNKSKSSREYRFSLSLSNDNENYTTVFSNKNGGGGNGWYSFQFINDVYARYVKFSGHLNSDKKAIHIVEFEIHDAVPPDILSTNVHSFNISGIGLTSETKIKALIENVVAEKSDLFEGIDSKIREIDRYLKQTSEAVNNVQLIKQTHGYLTESVKNNRIAMWWLVGAGIAAGAFFGLLSYFILCDDLSFKIIKDAANDKDLKPFTTVFLGAYYFAKAVLLSTILFLLRWTLINYRSEKHNYVINKHKAMTLTVAIGILTKEDFENSDRKNIFNRGMEMTFTHQSTGFSKEDSSRPDIVNNLIQKGESLMN